MIQTKQAPNQRRRLKIIESSTSSDQTSAVYGLDYLTVEHEKNEKGETVARLSVFFLGRAPDSFACDDLSQSVLIEGGTRIQDIKVEQVEFFRPEDPDVDDRLEVLTNKLGDHSEYQLSLVQEKEEKQIPFENFDPFHNELGFNFHPDCASPESTSVSCDSEPNFRTPDIDYLAKDYESFRKLILDRLSVTVPDWNERHAADIGVTLVELLAYAADYLSYQQDAVATEAYFHTARQRISVRRHARLIDYHLHEGCNARAWVHIALVRSSSGNQADQSANFAPTEALTLQLADIFFTTGSSRNSNVSSLVFEPIRLGRDSIEIRNHHNRIQFYTWGATEFTLKRGATSATLVDYEISQPGATQSPKQQVIQQAPPSDQDYEPRPGYDPVVQQSQTYDGPASDSGKPNGNDYYGYQNDNQDVIDPDCPEVTDPSPSVKRALKLNAGDYLLLQEEISPQTDGVQDADPKHRQVVRLTSVQQTEDKLYQQPIVEIEWEKADALNFDLVVSQIADSDCRLIEGMAIAKGNILLVDHGQSVNDESIGKVPVETIKSPCLDIGQPGEVTYVAGDFRPRLSKTSVTFSVPAIPNSPASKLLHQDVSKALPAVRLKSIPKDENADSKGFPEAFPNIGRLPFEMRRKIREGDAQQMKAAIDQMAENSNWTDWIPKLSLLDSGASDCAFVLEVNNQRESFIRFGDDLAGKAPEPAEKFLADYRIGNGESGNVGAGAIRKMSFKRNKIKSEVELRVENPLPATGGSEPESIQQAKLLAPYAAKQHLERAVVAEDYAQIVKRDFPDKIQNATATMRWSGSGEVVHVVVDLFDHAMRSNKPNELTQNLQIHLEQFKRIGHRVVVEQGHSVPLRIKLSVCVSQQHYPANVLKRLQKAFSNGVTECGTKGFFHPDNLSFGDTIAASHLVSVAQGIEGVDGVTVQQLERWKPSVSSTTDSGGEKRVSMGPLEMPRVDNDPNFPEFGIIDFDPKGGR